MYVLVLHILYNCKLHFSVYNKTYNNSCNLLKILPK